MALVATGDRIKAFRELRSPKLTQEQLAEKAGIKRSRLAAYEAGRTEPPIPILKKIATVLQADYNELLDPDDAKPAPVRTPRTKAEPSGKIKIYGAVSAGDGNTATIDVDEMDVPVQFARDDYGALIVEGDSMLDFLHPSDIAIFRDWHTEKVGHIMAARLENGDFVVKKLVYENDRYILRSLNSRYPDITQGFTLCGFLVGFVRDDGPERLIRLNTYGLRPD